MRPKTRESKVVPVAGCLLVMFALTGASQAQEATPPAGLTLGQAVEDALRSYPSVRVSQEQIRAAAAGIRLARTAYLPRVDLLAQANRATRNNVFGLLLPQGTVPSISGPVLGTNSLGSAWGSAVGTLLTWEPFDFGLRQASVAAATAARTQQEATLKRTQFEVMVAAADAYVTLVAAQETVRAAQAGMDRAEVIFRTISALVNAQLRPGADASRAQAELAAARTQLIQARQAVEVARANLSQFVGLEPAQITISAPKLLQLPPDQTMAQVDTATNPLSVAQNAVVE
jgi:outer membrane protein